MSEHSAIRSADVTGDHDARVNFSCSRFWRSGQLIEILLGPEALYSLFLLLFPVDIGKAFLGNINKVWLTDFLHRPLNAEIAFFSVIHFPSQPYRVGQPGDLGDDVWLFARQRLILQHHNRGNGCDVVR
ncbi:hypothetical protein J916_3597, partial [Acinetobacter baumannii 25493_3]